MEQLDFLNQNSEGGSKSGEPKIIKETQDKQASVRYHSHEVIFGETIKPEDDCPHGDTYGNCPSCRFKLPKEKPTKTRGRKVA